MAQVKLRPGQPCLVSDTTISAISSPAPDKYAFAGLHHFPADCCRPSGGAVEGITFLRGSLAPVDLLAVEAAPQRRFWWLGLRGLLQDLISSLRYFNSHNRATPQAPPKCQSAGNTAAKRCSWQRPSRHSSQQPLGTPPGAEQLHVDAPAQTQFIYKQWNNNPFTNLFAGTGNATKLKKEKAKAHLAVGQSVSQYQE